MEGKQVMNKDLKKLLAHYKQFDVTRTRRHIKIIDPKTNGFVIAPISGSDRRGIKNLERDLRHLCAGVGYGQSAWREK